MKEQAAATNKLSDTILKGAVDSNASSRQISDFRKILEGHNYQGKQSPGLSQMMPSSKYKPQVKKHKKADKEVY